MPREHVYKRLELAARAYAKRQGWTSKAGGWIYGRNGRPLMQGYGELGRRLERSGAVTGDWRTGYRLSETAR